MRLVACAWSSFEGLGKDELREATPERWFIGMSTSIPIRPPAPHGANFETNRRAFAGDGWRTFDCVKDVLVIFTGARPVRPANNFRGPAAQLTHLGSRAIRLLHVLCQYHICMSHSESGN